MRIFSIVANSIYNLNQVQHPKKSNANPFVTNPIPFDTVSFTASRASGEPLRKLAEYLAEHGRSIADGIPDMYTGQPMLTSGQLTRMLDNGIFEFPLKRLIPILKKYEATMLETEHKVFKIFEKAEKNQPNITITDVLKQQFPEHQKKLLSEQQPVFERLIEKACDLPPKKYKEFMDLMRFTSKKITKDPVVAHFSENEFIYKLNQVRKQIRSKNNRFEVKAINNLIREAKTMFSDQVEEKKKFGRGFHANKAKMEFQMQPHILKKNTQKIQRLRKMFDNSVLKNNKELMNIFKNTSAKICGLPIVEPFKRKEFIYDLKNLLKDMHNKKLADKMVEIAHQLPTSRKNVSAFMVKHINDSPNNIGWRLMKNSLISIEHIETKVRRVKPEEVAEELKEAKKSRKNRKNIIKTKADVNHVYNYGLSAAGINTDRSNMPFDEWIRKTPQSYWTIPLFMERVIKAYNEGIFPEVGLDKSYIPNLAKTIATKSPKEKPIILKIGDLNK